MGSEMKIAFAKAPYKAGGAGQWSNEADKIDEVTLDVIKRGRVAALTDTVLDDALTAAYYDFLGNSPLIDGDGVGDEKRASLRQQTRDALIAFPLAHARDLAYLWIGGRYYYGTGGLSWSETFDRINLLNEVALWDEEITDDEVAAARRHCLPDARQESITG